MENQFWLVETWGHKSRKESVLDKSIESPRELEWKLMDAPV